MKKQKQQKQAAHKPCSLALISAVFLLSVILFIGGCGSQSNSVPTSSDGQSDTSTGASEAQQTNTPPQEIPTQQTNALDSLPTCADVIEKAELKKTLETELSGAEFTVQAASSGTNQCVIKIKAPNNLAPEGYAFVDFGRINIAQASLFEYGKGKSWYTYTEDTPQETIGKKSSYYTVIDDFAVSPYDQITVRFIPTSNEKTMITVFFYGPNLQNRGRELPQAEYLKLEYARKVAARINEKI